MYMYMCPCVCVSSAFSAYCRKLVTNAYRMLRGALTGALSSLPASFAPHSLQRLCLSRICMYCCMCSKAYQF